MKKIFIFGITFLCVAYAVDFVAFKRRPRKQLYSSTTICCSKKGGGKIPLRQRLGKKKCPKGTHQVPCPPK